MMNSMTRNLPLQTEWKGPFSFIQRADCQLGFFEKDLSWEKEKQLLEKTVQKINELQPQFVILCGDITNARPNHTQYSAQVQDYKNIVSKIQAHIPLVCLCGNHDVGDRPTAESIKAYEDNFGAHFYSFWVRGVHCVALNSSLLKDPTEAPELDQQQNEWLHKMSGCIKIWKNQISSNQCIALYLRIIPGF